MLERDESIEEDLIVGTSHQDTTSLGQSPRERKGAGFAVKRDISKTHVRVETSLKANLDTKLVVAEVKRLWLKTTVKPQGCMC